MAIVHFACNELAYISAGFIIRSPHEIMATCSYIPTTDDQEKLALAKFSHGNLQRKPDGSWSKAPSFTLMKSSESEDRRKNLRRILAAEADSMQYVGQNYGEHASKANSMCKYMVGVVNRKKGKMRVMDAQLFELHPWLGKKDNTEDKDERVEELSFTEKKDLLTEAFGSSRKQRAMESRLKNKVGTKALESSAAKALSHAATQPNIKSEQEEEENDLLPPCDRTARRPQDVYKLDDIILPSHQEVLHPLAEELVDGALKKADEWKKAKKYPQYVLDHLSLLAGNYDDKRRITQATCLLYITYLMQLHIVKPKALNAKSCLEDVPPVVRTNILDTFTQMAPTPDGRQEKRFLPPRLKAKLLSYILVLAQIVDSYHTNTTPLLKDLSMSIKKLVTHARAIGCRSVTQGAGSTTTPKKRRFSKVKLEPEDEVEGEDDFVFDLGGKSESKGVVYLELNAPIKTRGFGQEARRSVGKRR